MNLSRAIVIATEAHSGQVDKGGNPYILHPLRVMLSMTNDETRIAAVLHDVVEDTKITFNDLRREGFSEEIIEAIDSVTKRKGETYDQQIQRAKLNPIGRSVKLGDLKDNSDISRIPNPTEVDINRTEKYKRAISELLTRGEII